MALAGMIIFIVLVLVTVVEVSFRLGRMYKERYDEPARSQITTVQAATLGLLALMLGFTMSMADARFARRRQINVDEAAAVSTAYLRALLLPEPERSESRGLFHSYVAERRNFYRATPAEAPAVSARTHVLQDQLWTRAISAARVHPDWDVLAAYVESLNNMFDLEAARSLAIQARLPGEIHIVLLLIATAAISITGFLTGMTGSRSAFSLYVIPILIALTCALIVDLDRARFGLITTGDRPMERIEHWMQAEQTATR